ncbi:hypothetical protein Rin_00001790 [Candidatus Regiella insecticola 5.15]|uniref:Uncharacterized protein n=1 Tax=Candidatus Regiella insecticola 5.15 TaxID=1005043 RepID=G2GWP4_9ENTR|nr:hypothetical protein [Candidatus Regiella insecticola]EGY29856.1 hypothetical protein Rin_00001790 [Candidatus Regiella insecticola 5.15]
MPAIDRVLIDMVDKNNTQVEQKIANMDLMSPKAQLEQQRLMNQISALISTVSKFFEKKADWIQLIIRSIK